MGHGWTVNDGTFDHVPLDKRRRRDVPYPSFVNHTYRSMNGLASLQLAHDAPINICAMDTAVEHIWKCMPGEARRYLYMPPPNGPALWGASDKSYKDMLEKMDQKVYHIIKNEKTNESQYRCYLDLKKRPWVIWPIWVEDKWGSDWVTLIWHSRYTDEAGDRFDELVSYAIIDPRREPEADASGKHQPINGRLERIRTRLFELWDRAGFNRNNAQQMNVLCSPMPLNETTSGERCFAVVKDLINQIIDWYISGMEFNHSTTITSMRQWVNPFQQRIEMTGINAWILMSTFDYNARIAVEAIQPNTQTEVAVDGNRKYLYPYDLAGPYNDPPIAAYDYLIPANKQYTAPA
ncbi:hypothetical protein HD806DRAFT_523078 [Xylariaceae sp. AK1471]|nr:hypothetical protein HD806DRAFT_523078 [Xylariaceae sp. AK1471]